MKDININLYKKALGRDVYEVIGAVDRYTDEQLMDKCDLNNFGGWVERYDERGLAMVVVYTD